ncbi:hypothetical protein QX233_07410 [Chryseobacterium gambrini]|uniref:Uncharacterized protein n=1 Tax=Chryseobacterium gambrini TaxID=373672 RepID=A0AAJ1R626_9FLAO|nr:MULTISPECIES: hypothetical protein [Chryseobacterium]MDN4012278.1 hypothetical protein [Chryseobacterium gambrini]MDN4030551.1 hypothetical protein [Chryseobacterium gambrini]QWA36851.1 hypothetical protein KKI44_12960 [Chryseobacterium sp. ZHDP1]
MERRFIFRKDTQKGVFDQKLNASTSLQKLCEDPTALPLTIETEQTLKAKDAVFYDQAVRIARIKQLHLRQNLMLKSRNTKIIW